MNAIKLSALAVAGLATTAIAAPVQSVTHAGRTVAVDAPATLLKTITHPAAVSAEVGTLGAGANVAWSINEKTELQAGWAGGDVSKLIGDDFQSDGVRYDVEADFSNPYLGVQLRPAGNWFTVGAGTIVPKNDIKVTLKPESNGTVTIDGTEYLVNGAEIKSSVKHQNRLAPYATIGVRPNLNNKWGLFAEAGGAYLGSTDASVNVTKGYVEASAPAIPETSSTNPIPSVNGNGATGSGALASSGPTLSNAEFEQAAKQNIERKDKYKWLPIVKLGATYRF